MATTIQPEEPEEPKEGDSLFHSHMCMKGTPLHFIIERMSHKNLTSAEVIKIMKLTTMPHPQPYTIGWEETSTSGNNVACPTTSIPSNMIYCVMLF
jgi:hypothetical protein